MARADIALPGLEDARQLTGLEDPDAIADAIARLSDDRAFARSLGAEGRSLVATEYDPALSARALEQLLVEVAA